MAEPASSGPAGHATWRAMRRARWWVLAPPMMAWPVAVPSILYVLSAGGEWPADAGWRLLAPAAVVMLFLAWLTRGRIRARMAALWELGKPGAAASREQLKRALSELSGLPGFVFMINFQHWTLALLGFSATLARLESLRSVAPLLRLVVAGCLFSPITGLLSRFACQAACRHVIQRLLQEDLSPEEVFEAVPPGSPRLRNHAVTFVVVSLLFALLFFPEVAFTATEAEVELLVLEPDPAMAESLARWPVWQPYVLLALTALVSVGIALFFGTILGGPLRRIGEQGPRLARADLEAEVIPAEEEAWAVSVALTRMRRALRVNLDRLGSAGARLSSTGRQMGATFEEQRSGTGEQVSALNETFATTEELARSAAQIAENAQEVAAVAQKTLAAAVEAQSRSEQFHAGVLRMKLDNHAVTDSVVKLNKRMQQIGKVVGFINEIADKSELLALNAALEGTRAGRVGKGFSLVAAELRRLSETVIHSTREIARLIQEIRDATDTAVMATEAGLKATEAGARSADRVLLSLAEILDLATQTSESVRSISEATYHQQSVAGHLSSAMADILRVTEQSADATRQMAGATGDLSSLASDLANLVDAFRNPVPPPSATPAPPGATA